MCLPNSTAVLIIGLSLASLPVTARQTQTFNFYKRQNKTKPDNHLCNKGSMNNVNAVKPESNDHHWDTEIQVVVDMRLLY